MTNIRQTVRIDAPAAQVWETLADFGKVATFSPTVKSSSLTSDQPGGLGATRECVLAPMGTIQERVTAWDEGRMLGIEIYDRKNVPGLRQADAIIEVEALGDKSKVTMNLDYEVGLGPIGAGMNAIALKRRFVKATAGLLAGLKHHVETGEAVDGKTDLPFEAVVLAA